MDAGGRRAADFLAFVGALHFMEEALAIVLVDHLQARLHVVTMKITRPV